MGSLVREVVEGQCTAVTLGHLALKATHADAAFWRVTALGLFLLLGSCTNLISISVQILLKILSLGSTLSSPMRFSLNFLIYGAFLFFHSSPLPISQRMLMMPSRLPTDHTPLDRRHTLQPRHVRYV